MSHHIPNDIIIEILSRLPVKSLIRFRRVCKHWYSIITNHSFITTHLNRFGQTTTDQLLISLDQKDRILFLSNDENFDNNYPSLELPFNDLRVVDSCNGLICLIPDDYKFHPINVMIWNPCIRKLVTLDFPKTTGKYGKIVIGFGFDLVENIFKVVRIMNGIDNPPHNHFDAEVQVYDQKGEEWRQIGCVPPHYKNFYCWFNNQQVFLHGAVHWVVRVYPHNVHIIVAFDMKDEVFREIAMPNFFSKKTVNSPTMVKCLFEDSLVVFGSEGPWYEYCHVWMMKDYGVFESWTNLYTIELPLGITNFPLGFRNNGEILFLILPYGLASYDPETKKFETTRIKESVWPMRTMMNFVESLVLLA